MNGKELRLILAAAMIFVANSGCVGIPVKKDKSLFEQALGVCEREAKRESLNSFDDCLELIDGGRVSLPPDLVYFKEVQEKIHQGKKQPVSRQDLKFMIKVMEKELENLRSGKTKSLLMSFCINHHHWDIKKCEEFADKRTSSEEREQELKERIGLFKIFEFFAK